MEDALKNPNWKSAMDEEMEEIEKNENWKLISPPKHYRLNALNGSLR